MKKGGEELIYSSCAIPFARCRIPGIVVQRKGRHGWHGGGQPRPRYGLVAVAF